MQAQHPDSAPYAAALRAHGFRITAGRVKLLSLLQKRGTPMSVQAILSRWKNAPDQATLYRTLSALADAGIVARADLNTGVAHFEYTPGKPHHHHIVCTGCGAMEDVEACAAEEVQKRVQRASKHFRAIDSHDLEFFGRCVQCA